MNTLYEMLDMSIGSYYEQKYNKKIDFNNKESMIDAVFMLFQRATKHTIAWIVSSHGEEIAKLMNDKYARMKED